MINIFDNKINKVKEIYNEITSLPYYYGETDNPNDVPSGMTCPINENHLCFLEIYNFLQEEKILNDLKINSAYVNIFAPGEYCNFHIDNFEKQHKTLLYYPNISWDINDGGETKFMSDNNTLISILPIPGRVILFNSNISHSASSFKNKHRFSIAFKLEPK